MNNAHLPLKYCGNTHNPEAENAMMYHVYSGEEDRFTSWNNHLEWLKQFTIGEPSATDYFTVEELKAMDMVGLYLPEDAQDE